MWETMIQRHKFVFMDDKARFEGLSAAETRHHFGTWAAEELERNWRVQPVTDDMRGEMHRPGKNPRSWSFHGTRYNVCMVVDDVCLQSLGESWPGFYPIVRLVRKQWDPTIVVEKGDEVHPDYEDDWMTDHHEGPAPAGWIYVGVNDYVELYDHLQDPHQWEEDHRFMYPSHVYESMGREKSPGFYRQAMKNETG